MPDEPRRVRTQAERAGDDHTWREAKARVEPLAQPGHDRDCALAMLNQARQRGGIDDIQVEHLLAIGYRAGLHVGEERGWHRGFDHARRYPAPRRRWWHRLTRALAGRWLHVLTPGFLGELFNDIWSHTRHRLTRRNP